MLFENDTSSFTSNDALPQSGWIPDDEYDELEQKLIDEFRKARLL